MDEQNQQQEIEQSSSPEDGSFDDDAAAAAFADLDGNGEEPEETADQPEDGSEEESTEEAEEAEPEEEDEAESTVEVDGEQVPLKELKDGYLRQQDYSRNMNTLNESKKTVEAIQGQATLYMEHSEKFAQGLAQLIISQARLQNLEALDLNKIREENPAEYSAIAADIVATQMQLRDQQTALKGIKAQADEANNQIIGTKRTEMLNALKKSVPGWGDKLATELTQYAVKEAWSVEELQTMTDPRVAQALVKAMKYDALQANKPKVIEKVKGKAPVLKPGAAQPKQNARISAIDNLKKNPDSLDAATAAFAASGRR